ncbi:MAG: hypothetical protein IJ043_08645 [Clostridia bacterium]|nr:hypothetical protein [Clostridia bacterium]
MGAKQQEEKQGFWQRYKFYFVGIIGAILLIASMSVQNVLINYKLEDGTQYAVKLDYSAFGLCLRVYPGTKNANDIVEKAAFFCTGKEKSVKNAALGLQEIAGTEEGTMQLMVGGVLGNNSKNAEELVEYLQGLGFEAEVLNADAAK